MPARSRSASLPPRQLKKPVVSVPGEAVELDSDGDVMAPADMLAEDERDSDLPSMKSYHDDSESLGASHDSDFAVADSDESDADGEGDGGKSSTLHFAAPQTERP